MKLLLEVVAEGDAAIQVRQKYASREHCRAYAGKVFFLQRPDRPLQMALLQINELEDVPMAAILRVEPLCESPIRLSLSVVSSEQEAEEIFRQNPPHARIPPRDGRTYFVQKAEGSLQPVLLELSELDDTPRFSILRILKLEESISVRAE